MIAAGQRNAEGLRSVRINTVGMEASMRRMGMAGLLVGLLLVGFEARADVVEYELAVEPPRLEVDAQGYTHLRLAGGLAAGRPGAPALPLRLVRLLLPPGQTALAVEVERAEPVPIAGEHAVFPIQPPQPLSRPRRVRAAPDAVIYGSHAAYPAQPLLDAEKQSLRGFGVLVLRLSPLVYHPASGRLAYSPWLRLRVTTGPERRPSGELAAFRGRAADFERVAALVANPQALAAYPLRPTGDRAPDYRYIIVTSQAMADCGGPNNLQALAADKEARGIPTRIETVESIRSGYSGADDAARIRAFLRDMYDNHGAEFVLLAGDADGAEVGGETQAPVVAVRDLWGNIGSGDDDLPSDLYYAALDGDFDADGDGVYGESGDDADLLAELSVGRAPVDSCQEVDHFVRKTLAYGNAGSAYLNRVLMVGEFLWGDGNSAEDWGKGYLERIRVSSDANGIDTLGFSENPFFQAGTLYDRDLGGAESWDGGDMLAELNAEPHIINHLGHSYTFYNMRLTADEIDAGMSNQVYFFEYSQGCYCGAFDNRLDDQYDREFYWQDSFAEHMTLRQHGAFAVLMNTRYGLGGYSNLFHRLFWDALFRSGQDRLGPMHDASRDQLAGYVGADSGMRWVFYAATLFGDPEVALHTSAGSGDPMLGLPAEAPWFVFVQGVDDEASQVVQLRNDGGGSLDWQVDWQAPWLQVGPAAGTAPSEVTLTASAVGLELGLHQTELTFSAPQAANSPQTLPVEAYVIALPSALAPYNAAAAPSVDGTIGGDEYLGGATIDMDPNDPGTATVELVHDGGQLYMAFAYPDADDDASDAVVLVIDNADDGGWPAAAGADGELQLLAGYDSAWFAPYSNSGGGLETGEFVEAQGVVQAWGRDGDQRVLEAAFDLSSGPIQRSMGQSVGLFLFAMDQVSDQDWQTVANWPWALQSLDDARYLASVTIGSDSDSLLANPAALTFTAVQGGGPCAPAELTISSTSATQFTFDLAPGADWLHVAPASGTTPTRVEVWADPAGRSVGPHSADLLLTAAGADNSPLPVPVTFQVDPAPAAIAVSPRTLSFEHTVGTDPPAGQAISISNAGGGSLSWSAVVQGDWVHLSQSAGSAPSTVTVTPVVQDLGAGFHAGSIRISAPGADPVRVELGIEVRDQPQLAVDPNHIEKYDAVAGDPVEVEFYVSNAQWGTMDWSVSTAADWVSLAPASGTYVSGHPSLVVATLDPAGLEAGLHQAEVLIDSPRAGNAPLQLTIDWTLSAGPAIAVAPGALEFTAEQGGADPAPQQLQINNAGSGRLGFDLDCRPAWLRCSPTSGDAPAAISVSASGAGLEPGRHSGSVRIASDEAVNAPFEVPVALRVDQGQVDNRPPPAPGLFNPTDMADIYTANPELIAEAVVDPDGHALTYTFEVRPMGQQEPWVVMPDVVPGAVQVVAAVTKTLDFDAAYQWRVRAVDSQGLAGDWSQTWMFNVHGPDDGGGGCGCATRTPAGSGLLVLLLGLLLLRGRCGRWGWACRAHRRG